MADLPDGSAFVAAIQAALQEERIASGVDEASRLPPFMSLVRQQIVQDRCEHGPVNILLCASVPGLIVARHREGFLVEFRTAWACGCVTWTRLKVHPGDGVVVPQGSDTVSNNLLREAWSRGILR